jgi:hypothetical protein
MAQAQIISLTDLQRSKISINRTKNFGDTKEFAVLPKTEYEIMKAEHQRMKEEMKAKELRTDIEDAKKNGKSYTNVKDLLHDLAT